MWVNAADYSRIKELQENGYVFTGKSRTNQKTGILQLQFKFSRNEFLAMKRAEANPYMNRKR